MKTPLGRVLGLGSARKGTQAFWHLRLTSVALAPLTVFVIVLAISLIGEDHAAVTAVLGQPVIAVPLILFIALSAYHMKLGMQEIIEDYVHGGARLPAVIGNIGFCAMVAIAAGYAVLKLGLGG